MENKHWTHVKKNSIKYDGDFNNLDWKFNHDNKGAWLFMDIENCTDKEGDFIAENGSRVYGWGQGCLYSDMMIYGRTLDEYFASTKSLFEEKFRSMVNSSTFKVSKDTKYNKNIHSKYKDNKYLKEKYITFNIGVHNLAYELEFFKYWFYDNGFNFDMGDLVKGTKDRNNTKLRNKIKYSKSEKTYHVLENNNVVYSCDVYFPMDVTTNVTADEESPKAKIGLHIHFFDTAKVILLPLEKFNKIVDKDTDPMFYKMKESYDYKAWRSKEHWQSKLELRYQYNDIYMTRKGWEDYVINVLCDGKIPTKGLTTSAIAFNKLKEMTFKEDEYTEDGKKMSVNAKYRKYVGLDREFSSGFEDIEYEAGRSAYAGGFTHANPKYLQEHIQFILGSSFDINSSYPDKMRNCPLPYGVPRLYYPDENYTIKDDEWALVEVGFDYFRPKKKEYVLEMIKIGADNSTALREITGDVSAREYCSTNITVGGRVIPVYRNNCTTTLPNTTKQWMVKDELEHLLKYYEFGCFKYEPMLDEEGEIVRNEVYEPIMEIVDDSIDFSTGINIGMTIVYKAEVGKYSDFINHYAKMKIDHRLTGEDAKVIGDKTFLNSCYGKFATKDIHFQRQFEGVNDKGVISFCNAKEKIIDEETGEINEIKISYKDGEFPVYVACAITAYARIHLQEFIINCIGVDNFIYGDTDSVYCKISKEEVEKRTHEYRDKFDKDDYRYNWFTIDGANGEKKTGTLGQWDNESQFDEFKVLGQKKYMYHSIVDELNHIKCCGLPEKAQNHIANNINEEGKAISSRQDAFEEFKLGKKIPAIFEDGSRNPNAKLQKLKVKGGYLLMETDFEIQQFDWLQ